MVGPSESWPAIVAHYSEEGRRHITRLRRRNVGVEGMPFFLCLFYLDH